MAAVDTKRGYMGMCNGCSAQQESGAALSKEQYVYGGGQILYTAIMPARCALIRDRQPTAWDDFVRPAIRKVSHQIVVERNF